MDDQTITLIVEETAPLLEGRAPGKIFQLSPLSFAIDFRTRDKNYLLISAEPNQPRLHMMARRVTELEKRTLPLSQFGQALKSELGQTQLHSLTKDPRDRIVRFEFVGQDELGRKIARTLIAQLTGRAANLFIVDEQVKIIRALRPGRGSGQAVGEIYEAPVNTAAPRAPRKNSVLEKGPYKTLSEAADAYFKDLDATSASDAVAVAARSDLRKQIAQRRKLLQQLERDLSAQADAEEHKRIGDLLLANIANAKRRGDSVLLTDYFAEGAPIIEVPVDAGISLQDEAARRFARFAKSKRARQEIQKRLESVSIELEKLHARQTALEEVISGGDQAALEQFIADSSSSRAKLAGKPKRKPEETIPGVRRYLSTDGYEILVGRAARDNDHLTFKVARPYDLWLHAADYPGSHVIVRNPTRKEIPHRTLIEAAQLTAYFSHARKDTKVSVHYSQRKFLSKPKGAAPGLVRMSSFKTITVEPAETLERNWERGRPARN